MLDCGTAVQQSGFTKKHRGSLHVCVCVCSALFVVRFRIISSGQMKMQGVYGFFRCSLGNQRPAVIELG